MAYNGSVEVVSGLKQKNGADFPIVEASAVYVADDKSLADIIDGIENINLKEYFDNANQSQQTVMDSYGTRISTVENTIGTMTGDKSIAQKLIEIDNEIGLNASEDSSLKNRVSSLESSIGTMSGDKTIAQKLEDIDNEIGLNTSADNSLKNRVTLLETNVGDGVVTDRINSAVTSEKNRAIEEETNIKSRVSSLESAVGSGGSIDSRIANETTRATTRENEINTALTNEITRATEEDNALNTAIDNEITRATGEETVIKNRVDSLESVVGARSIEAEDALSYRIECLEESPMVMSVSNNTEYATHLNTITDASGNVLAYFDLNGNFHVNGNIYSENW